ncbi:uncharacterized protein LOC133198224 [Saccostrea echinata]|uniref:uncharacterized protein LOC133198224 n=1 Tax=Saccostrea echinata TaxID=191078 RepID=UPI002A7EC1F4|nr:uncharacterized protein LOC133198224 [Saccostrea echinata]
MYWLPEVHKNQLSEGNTLQHEHELITDTETALRMKDSFRRRMSPSSEADFYCQAGFDQKGFEIKFISNYKNSKWLAQMWKWNRTLLVGNSMEIHLTVKMMMRLIQLVVILLDIQVFSTLMKILSISLLDQTKK